MGIRHIRKDSVEVLRTSGLKNLKPNPQLPRCVFCVLQPSFFGALGPGIWLEEKSARVLSNSCRTFRDRGAAVCALCRGTHSCRKYPDQQLHAIEHAYQSCGDDADKSDWMPISVETVHCKAKRWRSTSRNADYERR
jgi:hypothetical protein